MKKDDFVWMMINPLAFCTTASGVTLRRYQEQVLTAVLDSIYRNLGLTFVVMFPRQSGKNELQAQLEVFLLALYERTGMEIVKVSPTWKPQSLNAMRRLERVLSRNRFTRRRWMRESGYIYRVGDARIFFLSGEPHANIVGATASLLLEVDEAQDVLTAKYDKERRKYHDYYAAGTWGNAAFYDLTINSSILGVGGTVELVCSFVRQAESGRERQA